LIPSEFIDELRQRADIVSIIAEHVELKRSGGKYFGLCPFHAEKTPSFHVDAERRRYHCFGCHAGGNVYKFLMERENLSFPDAVRRVAEKTGMEMPVAPMSAAEQARAAAAKRYLQAHAAATAFYHDLLTRSEAGRPARKYLKSRQISPEAAERFSLGYAPDAWDGLSGKLRAEGFSEQELVSFGLLKQREGGNQGGGAYDRFRARLMFPILDVQGRPVAFGGRVLNEANSPAAPKYLNSPETPFFQKGKHLYGLHSACRQIGAVGYALLVEGYMDVIAAQNAGFTQAVASLGTALTSDQAKLLKRYGRRVIIGYDNDAAGKKAALSAGEIFLAEGLRTEVLVLKEAKDPDEYLRGRGPEQFAALLAESPPFIEFKYREFSRGRDVRSVADRAELIRLLAPDILRLGRVEQEGYIRFLSRELGLTLEAVQAEVEGQPPATRRFPPPAVPPPDPAAAASVAPPAASAIYAAPTAPAAPLGLFRAEQLLLRAALDDGACRPQILRELGPDFWLAPEHRFLFENANNPDIYSGDDDFYRRCQRRLAELYSSPFAPAGRDEIVADCILTVKREQERQETEELQSQMILLESSGDTEGALRLLKVIRERLQENGGRQRNDMGQSDEDLE
jgi:DNA primase